MNDSTVRRAAVAMALLGLLAGCASSGTSAGRPAQGGKSGGGSAATLDARGGFGALRLGMAASDIPGSPAEPEAGYTDLLPLDYGGIELDAVYFFSAGKLDGVAFNTKRPEDCQPLRKALEAELGPPGKTEATDEGGTSYEWRGSSTQLTLDMIDGLCIGSFGPKR